MKKKFVLLGLLKLLFSLLIIGIILCLFFFMGEDKSLYYLFSEKADNEKIAIIDGNNDAKTYIYCTDMNYSGTYKYSYELKANGQSEQIKELLEKLYDMPLESSYINAIPSYVGILNYRFGEDVQLIIDFDEKYYEMSSIEEAICRSSIVKTICQLDGISEVEFYINGIPLMNEEKPIGAMTSLDFVDNTGAISDYNQKYDLNIYFTDAEGKTLHLTEIFVESVASKLPEELVLNQLINGPLESQMDLRPVLPLETKVNKVKTTDGICYVDFNEHFLDGLEGVKKDITVYSVVNSLCEIKGISKVKITINGDDKIVYGNSDFSDFMILKPSLIFDEKAGG